MTHIPDEAVQAALDAVQGNIPPAMLEKALQASIPHLSAPCAVEVKKLDWEYNDRPNRTYQVSDERGSIYYIDQTFGPDSYYFTTIRCGDGFLLYDGDDLPSAQAAAQADFERRIRECIVAKPVDVAAVRRQAFEEGFENGVEQSLNALDSYDDITRNVSEQGIRKLKPDYRALSAAITQGDDE